MKQFNILPFPIFTTERLILRQLEIGDVNELFILRSDEKVNKYIDRPRQTTIEQINKFINKINDGIAKNECVYWAITLKNKNTLIGTICYWNFTIAKDQAEIGYELHPDYQGKGIMQEALSKVIPFGFDNLRLTAIKAYTHPDNQNSIKLLEKNHFRKKRIDATKNEGKEIIYTLDKTNH